MYSRGVGHKGALVNQPRGPCGPPDMYSLALGHRGALVNQPRGPCGPPDMYSLALYIICTYQIEGGLRASLPDRCPRVDPAGVQ